MSSSTTSVPPTPRGPLIEFISKISDPDLVILFDILQVAKDNLIFETTDEALLMQEFMINFFIAAKSQHLFLK